VLGDEFGKNLADARRGSDAAWARIYRDLAPSVFGYLRGRGERESEDLTGEVFLQVVRDLPTFEGAEREFRSWVFVIAHHRLLDERRRRARKPVEPRAEVPDVGGRSTDAAEQALDRIAAERVERIIGQLPQEQKAVLLLRVLGQLTVAEVATVVGKSPGAVKALQRRGLRAVERTIAREGVPL
jgi:RNA polymerase sigma factor (sigma-70 family)